LADYTIRLAFAGRDCRVKLGEVKRWVEQQIGTDGPNKSLSVDVEGKHMDTTLGEVKQGLDGLMAVK